jgi:hypothetical protein
MISSQLSGAAGTTLKNNVFSWGALWKSHDNAHFSELVSGGTGNASRWLERSYYLLFGIPVFWRNQPNTHFNVVKLYQATIESQARG